jgi:hypothetical protein
MRPTVRSLAGILLIGCAAEPTVTATNARQPAEPTATRSAAGASVESAASVERDLATLRRVTASFHDFQAAFDAHWSTKITACMESPDGGMGFHYGNVGIIDGTARVDEPELLLYEPEKNGKLHLVAVEYIIPYTAHSRSAEPPVLFGQPFAQKDVFQLWGLHAWVWKNNPSGMFAPWNPTVTCENTTDVAVMLHH